jgi:uncharacterized phage protein (TIGR01671 family)
MREILFRGKRVDNGEWVEGMYVHRTKFYGDSCDDHFILIGGEYVYDHHNAYKVYPETVGQYTGIEDRNGKKIFELDIISHVKYPDEPALICWHETGFAIKGLWYSTDISSRKADIEVVGNIHDNPELIGGEKK